jgi:predicted acyltransferase
MVELTTTPPAVSAEPEEKAIESPPEAKANARLVSLDAFRGLTILLMLLVNNIALDTATPAHLMHAPWNEGVRLADLVFPWFLLCVGIAIPFSARSALKKGVYGWRYAGKVLSRVLMLFALGLLVDSAIQRQPIFGLGVLQLIALAYLGGAILYRLPAVARIVACGVLLAAYGLALKYIPVPGIGIPMFEEGANLVRHVNDAYLTTISLRGLPSIIPTAALVGLGSLLGDFVLAKKGTAVSKMAMLMAIGGGVSLLGFWWNLALPFNKPVWTPAYILLSAGLGAILIALLYGLFDLGNRGRWAFPLVVFGSNALLAYVGPILVKMVFLQVWKVGPPDARRTLQEAWLTSFVGSFGQVVGGLSYTLSYIGIVWIVLLICYVKGLFLRV